MFSLIKKCQMTFLCTIHDLNYTVTLHFLLGGWNCSCNYVSNVALTSQYLYMLNLEGNPIREPSKLSYIPRSGGGLIWPGSYHNVRGRSTDLIDYLITIASHRWSVSLVGLHIIQHEGQDSTMLSLLSSHNQQVWHHEEGSDQSFPAIHFLSF